MDLKRQYDVGKYVCPTDNVLTSFGLVTDLHCSCEFYLAWLHISQLMFLTTQVWGNCLKAAQFTCSHPVKATIINLYHPIVIGVKAAIQLRHTEHLVLDKVSTSDSRVIRVDVRNCLPLGHPRDRRGRWWCCWACKLWSELSEFMSHTLKWQHIPLLHSFSQCCVPMLTLPSF